VLQFHILIHFLLEQNASLRYGKSLRFRQPEETLHKRQKQNPTHVKPTLPFKFHALVVEDRWVNGVSDNASSMVGVASEHDRLESELGGGNLQFQGSNRLEIGHTLMQFSRLSNATETVIPAPTKPPLPMAPFSPRTDHQICRVLHATGKYDVSLILSRMILSNTKPASLVRHMPP